MNCSSISVFRFSFLICKKANENARFMCYPCKKTLSDKLTL